MFSFIYIYIMFDLLIDVLILFADYLLIMAAAGPRSPEKEGGVFVFRTCYYYYH